MDIKKFELFANGLLMFNNPLWNIYSLVPLAVLGNAAVGTMSFGSVVVSKKREDMWRLINSHKSSILNQLSRVLITPL
jgi:hypothetical protein